MSIESKTGKYADIANRLRAVRAYYDLNSKDFAEQAEVPYKSYSQWESGQFRVSIDGAMKIERRYGISLDFIYLGRLDTLPNRIATALASNPSVKQTSASTVIPD
ncbi:helix-turn-helix transcriptional regulator [Thalassovita sp.]|uniref:helix-turn-helix transcriptional regulator n=1 Tax=Thalassovita sp. TaxID=1979401 RepID=UPI002AB30579|nr:helix-turn-helix transcriptional regulator [Thalassovita sp.]